VARSRRLGIVFIGPRSRVQAAAGKKDEAKRTALREGVTVTPGIDDATDAPLVRKHPSLEALRSVVRSTVCRSGRVARRRRGSAPRGRRTCSTRATPRLDLYSIDELRRGDRAAAASLLEAHPGHRVRLKAIGGGGGKGQRILRASSAAATPAAVRQRRRAGRGARDPLKR
jgi:biotin carboxylase